MREILCMAYNVCDGPHTDKLSGMSKEFDEQTLLIRLESVEENG